MGSVGGRSESAQLGGCATRSAAPSIRAPMIGVAVRVTMYRARRTSKRPLTMRLCPRETGILGMGRPADQSTCPARRSTSRMQPNPQPGSPQRQDRRSPRPATARACRRAAARCDCAGGRPRRLVRPHQRLHRTVAILWGRATRSGVSDRRSVREVAAHVSRPRLLDQRDAPPRIACTIASRRVG